MSDHAFRLAPALVAFALSLAVAGCAAWREPLPSLQPMRAGALPAFMTEAPIRAEPQQHAQLTHGAAEYQCANGVQLRVDYAATGESAAISLDGATPISMQRTEASGRAAYRADGMSLHRADPRVALTIQAVSVTVREGDTLGAIARRVYGDRAFAAQIAYANGVADANLIYPGQVLTMPRVEHRCRRALATSVATNALQRRAFSSPTRRQQDLQPINATTLDRRR